MLKISSISCTRPIQISMKVKDVMNVILVQLLNPQVAFSIKQKLKMRLSLLPWRWNPTFSPATSMTNSGS